MKDKQRRSLVLSGLVLVGSIGLMASTRAPSTAVTRTDCGWFDDWKDNIPGEFDEHYHAGTGGGLAAIYAAFGNPVGQYQQEGSQSGNNYHDAGETGGTGGSHAFCGDSTYYPYLEG